MGSQGMGCRGEQESDSENEHGQMHLKYTAHNNLPAALPAEAALKAAGLHLELNSQSSQ